MRAKRFDEAVRHYREATTLFPANYALSAASAAALTAAGDVTGALAVADSTIERWPDRPAAYLQRGTALDAMGDPSGARAAFRRASQLRPSDLRGPLFEGRMLAKLGRYQEASVVMESALDLPGASAPLVYYEVLLKVLKVSGADRARLDRVLARSRKTHGAAADGLLK